MSIRSALLPFPACALLLGGAVAAPQATFPAVATTVAQAQPSARAGLPPQIAQLRFAVLIPEEVLRRPVPDPAAETEIMRALVQGGFRVVDPTQQERNSARNLLRSPSAQAARDLQTRLQADYLITGEAFAEEHGAVSGLRGYTARLEVKVVDLASGQIVHAQAFQGSGVGLTDALAGKTALMNVGRAAGAQLPALLVRALGEAPQTARRALVLRIAGDPTFSQVSGLLTRLGAQPGVGDTVIRNVDAGGAVLEVQFGGSVAELGLLLERLGLTVTGLTGNELTARF